ncbi:MAG: MlaA family lipoprotein, partial [Alphaproteobacteria bacterium]|nr:MlaA family lipoprotein [Alphaproteobacteria bacterium]
PNRPADMGQTFAKWGAAEGPYVVMPVLGSYTVRSGAGEISEIFLNPVTRWEAREGNTGYGAAHLGLFLLDWRADNLEQIKSLRENSLDFYATVRSIYRQSRRNLANDIYDETSVAPILDDHSDFAELDDPLEDPE